MYPVYVAKFLPFMHHFLKSYVFFFNKKYVYVLEYFQQKVNAKCEDTIL